MEKQHVATTEDFCPEIQVGDSPSARLQESLQPFAIRYPTCHADGPITSSVRFITRQHLQHLGCDGVFQELSVDGLELCSGG